MYGNQLPEFQIALRRIVQQASTYDFQSIIDIGAGDGFAAKAFCERGKQVTVTDLHPELLENLPEDVTVYENLDVCDMSAIPSESYDAVWCSHVIEHVMDTGRALSEIRRILKPNGLAFLTVPPFEHRVLDGHVCPGWNIGILMYVLIVSGFDVINASFINYHSNVSAFVRKGPDFDIEIIHSWGDIDRIKHLFPPSLNVHQGWNGDIENYNWTWQVDPIDLDREYELKGQKLKNREFVFQFIPPILVKSYYSLKGKRKKV
ncbi:MAG: class I SAM-dependent methyltransferase [Cyanobacteria bacterium SID2]|nr:class I SAM-dependent methyltransferase [Cyanobacteria bacterium SID2]MBP0005978.1 class I SAM-dependent methyltransferase [Cyanobacteria bacterium SBC]